MTTAVSTINGLLVPTVDQVLPARKGRESLIISWQRNNNTNNAAIFVGGPPGVGTEIRVSIGIQVPGPGPIRIFRSPDDDGIVEGPIYYRRESSQGMFIHAVEVWCNCQQDE